VTITTEEAESTVHSTGKPSHLEGDAGKTDSRAEHGINLGVHHKDGHT
jgi:hypothetical protein